MQNNYAVIGDICFRILRTTDNEATKLAYYGKYKNNKCEYVEHKYSYFNGFGDETPLEAASPSYVFSHPAYGAYDENWEYITIPAKDNDDSSIKKVIDKFYEDNLLDYTDWFEDEVYCNDTTVTGTGYEVEYRPSTSSNWITNDPNLSGPTADKYTVSASKGNGKLKYPIASLSLDEYMLTLPRIYPNDPGDSSSWIRHTYFTLTPNGLYVSSGYHTAMFETNAYYNSYYPEYTNIYTDGYESLVLPVVAVTNEIEVIKGTGTEEDPYILNKPEPEEPVTPEPEVKGEEEEVEVENPQTGRYKMLWILPIIALGLYIAFMQLNKKGLFKNSYKEN